METITAVPISLPKQKEYKFQESDSIEWPTLSNQSTQRSGVTNKPQAKKSWAQAASRPTRTKPVNPPGPVRQQSLKQQRFDPQGVHSHQQDLYSPGYVPQSAWPSSTPQSFKKSSSAGEIEFPQLIQQKPGENLHGHQPQHPSTQRKKQRSLVPKSYQTNQTRTLSESAKDLVQLSQTELPRTVSARDSTELPSSRRASQPQSYQQDRVDSQSTSIGEEYHLPIELSGSHQQHLCIQSPPPVVSPQENPQTPTHTSVLTVNERRQVEHQQQTAGHFIQPQTPLNASSQSLHHSHAHADPTRRPIHPQYGGTLTHLQQGLIESQFQQTPPHRHNLQQIHDPHRHILQQYYSLMPDHSIHTPQVHV